MTPRRGRFGLNSVLAGSLAQVAGRFISLPVGLASTMFLSRYLGVDDFGRYSFVLAFWGVFNLASEMYVTPIVVGELGDQSRSTKTLWLAGVLVQTGYSVLAAVIGIVVAFVMFRHQAATMSGVFAGALLMLSNLSAASTVHQTRHRLWIPAAFGILQSVLFLISVLALRAASAPWQAFVVVNAVAGCTAVVGILLSGRRIVSGLNSASLLEEARRIVSLSVMMGIAALISVAYYRLDSVLVFKMAGATEAGYYAAAYRLYELVLFVATSIQMAALPAAARYLRENAMTFRGYITAVAQVAFGLGLTAALLLVFARGWIVGLVYGLDFARAAALLLALLPGLVARFMHIWLGALLIVQGARKRFIAVVSLAAVTAVTLNLLFVPIAGAMAAAIVTSLTETLMLLGTLASQPRGTRLRLLQSPASSWSILGRAWSSEAA